MAARTMPLPDSYVAGSGEPEICSQEELRNPIFLRRYEYKYLIHPALMTSIRSFLEAYCVLDPYSATEPNRFYTVRTLYLDTADYKTYWEKEHEVANRFKLRIRTYGQDWDGPVKFEVKRRFNDVSIKSSVSVADSSWRRLVAAPVAGCPMGFTRRQRSAFNNFIWLTRSLNARPKMLIQYERQAFQSRMDPYVRISFDRRICHQPTNIFDLIGQKATWVSNDDPESMGETGPRIVLELKFTNRAPVWLSDMVCRFDLVRRGFSKYATAVTRSLCAGATFLERSTAVPVTARIGRRRG